MVKTLFVTTKKWIARFADSLNIFYKAENQIEFLWYLFYTVQM